MIKFAKLMDKVRKTFGQNLQNLAYLSLFRRILSESFADFVQKLGGFYLPNTCSVCLYIYVWYININIDKPKRREQAGKIIMTGRLGSNLKVGHLPGGLALVGIKVGEIRMTHQGRLAGRRPRFFFSQASGPRSHSRQQARNAWLSHLTPPHPSPTNWPRNAGD